MLEFYAVDVLTENPSLDRIYLGGLGMDKFNDLIRLNIVSDRPSSFNYLSYFEDRYLSNSVVEKWLELAQNRYCEAQKTPGYQSDGVEKFISFFKVAVRSNCALQTLCD